MTHIGQPQRVIIAEPLELPAPLRKDDETPKEEPENTPVEVPELETEHVLVNRN